jgi:hypothetical protein
MEVVLLGTLKRLFLLSAHLLHAVRVTVALLQLLLASKQAILSNSAQMAEFQLLPFLALTPDALKTFAVMRLAALLTCLCSAPIALLISAPQLTAARTKRVLAITACLMNAALRHVPVTLTSNVALALLFALTRTVLSVLD